MWKDALEDKEMYNTYYMKILQKQQQVGNSCEDIQVQVNCTNRLRYICIVAEIHIEIQQDGISIKSKEVMYLLMQTWKGKKQVQAPGFDTF